MDCGAGWAASEILSDPASFTLGCGFCNDRPESKFPGLACSSARHWNVSQSSQSIGERKRRRAAVICASDTDGEKPSPTARSDWHC
jgi:hypothetical protein